MSWTERWTERLRHVDVRLGWSLAALFAPLVAVVLFSLYAFAADELLELARAELDERMVQLETALEPAEPSQRARSLALLGEELARDAGGFRVRDAAGHELARGGIVPPSPDAPSPMDRVLAAVRITPEDALRSQHRLGSGLQLELFSNSRNFVRERDDIQRGFWLSLALGIGLVLLAALPATRRALEPLRAATRALAAVDLDRLDARVPTRGTQDDVDHHAAAVNRVLDRLEVGVERVRAFSHDVAHELRTPMNRILNVAEVALLDPSLQGRARTDLEAIRNTAGQVGRLVDGLLLLAQGEEGELAVEAQRLSLAGLCKMLQEIYGAACEERGLRLEVGPVDGAVMGDAALLLRAVGNLMDNALLHTPAGGAIRLRTHAASHPTGQWILEVSDTGPGIPAADRERIFERLVRLDPRRAHEGSGLGLAIARALVRAHGGDIQLSSSQDAGAHFAVRLPAARA